MIYLVMFAASTLFLWRGNVKLLGKRKNRIEGIFFTSIGLLLPILLAAFRGETVGSDLRFYVISFFQRAQNYTSFIQYANATNVDIGYALITYLVAKLTTDIRWLFFVIAVLITSFAYAAFWNLRDYQEPWKMMLLYYFFCYCNSLSQVRQAITMAMILYGVSEIYKYNYQKRGYIACFVLVAIASTIQTGALVALLPIIIIYAVRKGLNLNKAVLPMLIALIIIGVFNSQIIDFMFRIASNLNRKYATYQYLTTYRSKGIEDNTTTALMCFFVFVLSIMIYRKLIKRKLYISTAIAERFHGQRSLLLLCIVTSAIVLVFEFFLSSFRVIMRLILTLQIFWPFALGMVQYLVKRTRFNRFFINLGIVLIVALYWYQLYIRVDMVHTAEYVLYM